MTRNHRVQNLLRSGDYPGFMLLTVKERQEFIKRECKKLIHNLIKDRKIVEFLDSCLSTGFLSKEIDGPYKTFSFWSLRIKFMFCHFNAYKNYCFTFFFLITSYLFLKSINCVTFFSTNKFC